MARPDIRGDGSDTLAGRPADSGQEVAGGAAVPDRLDRYEAAHLNGGCDLAATAAVPSLLRAGHLASSPRRGRRPGLVAGTPPAWASAG